MKVKIQVCDICREPMREVTHKIKIKKKWHSWYESGWDKMDLCEECADKIIYAIQNEVTKNDDR